MIQRAIIKTSADFPKTTCLCLWSIYLSNKFLIISYLSFKYYLRNYLSDRTDWAGQHILHVRAAVATHFNTIEHATTIEFGAASIRFNMFSVMPTSLGGNAAAPLGGMPLSSPSSIRNLLAALGGPNVSITEGRVVVTSAFFCLLIFFIISYARSPMRKLPPQPRRTPILAIDHPKIEAPFGDKLGFSIGFMHCPWRYIWPVRSRAPGNSVV